MYREKTGIGLGGIRNSKMRDEKVLEIVANSLKHAKFNNSTIFEFRTITLYREKTGIRREKESWLITPGREG